MKALLDTNIVIYRENQVPSNYSVGHLFRWLDKLRYTKVIHERTKEEIQRFQDPYRKEALQIKLDAYEVLKSASAPPPGFLDQLPPVRNVNDEVDNALLFEVYSGYVDLLVTEDKRLRAKARKIGIDDRVHSIESIIGKFSEEHPDLIEYQMLSVESRSFREIDLNDPFFDSLKEDYIGFANWFKSKSTERAYACFSQNEHILGFLYLKTEDETEDYRDIFPEFSPAKRLKVGTFKVESTGFRLGERFLQIIFDNARHRKVEEIYVTVVQDDPKRPEISALVQLLQSWGFRHHGCKTSSSGIEPVFIKPMTSYDKDLSVKENFPNLRFGAGKKRFLPILAKYHTHLFPDSILRNENPQDYASNVGFRYALQKMYISWASLGDTKVGDYILIYRMGTNQNRKKYESTVTTLGVITELKANFVNWDEFINYCSNRTVFTLEELRGFWSSRQARMTVVSFIYVCRLVKRPILGELWDNGIVAPPGGPRPFEELSDSAFRQILELAKTPVQFVSEEL